MPTKFSLPTFINFGAIWALATAEMRTSLRLVRTWIIIGIAFLFSLVGYLYIVARHASLSLQGPAEGFYNPRFLLAEIGSTFIFIFSLGIIFLAFDIRTRDLRGRITEVLDTRPVSNVELLVGRLSGIIVLLMIPMLVFIVLALGFGMLAAAGVSPIGDQIEIWSVLSLLVFDTVPNLAFVGALVILLAVVVRFRMIVLLMAIGWIALNMWLVLRLPHNLTEFFHLVAVNHYPSDLAPVFGDYQTLINRFSLMLIVVGMLWGAAALHPRRDSNRMREGIVGVGSIVVGLALIVGLFQLKNQEHLQFKQWSQVHAAEDIGNLADIQHITGSVEIYPARLIRLELNLDISMSTASLDETDFVVFSLNPGYKIEHLSLNSVDVLEEDYQFNDGLLKIASGLFSPDDNQFTISARGVPNEQFAYLDSVVNYDEKFVLEREPIRLLGSENYIFHAKFVALVPGIKWLPNSGPAVMEDNLEHRSTDYFTFDLTVSVPKGWTAAAPGERKELSDQRRTVYQFSTENSVPAVCLIAANFEQRTVEIEGVEFELLFSKAHRRNFNALGPVVQAIQENEGLVLQELQEAGLRYPYRRFSIVEVPTRLRLFSGGWHMKSILSQPGLVMLREAGFPLSRFDRQAKSILDGAESEADASARLHARLRDYFENDLHGGNPKLAFIKNLLFYQTSPHHHGATPLSLVVDDLMNSLSNQELVDYFSMQVLQVLSASGVNRSSIVEIRDDQLSNPAVWSSLEANPLSKLDFYSDPIQAYNTVLLKSTYLIELVLEDAGRSNVFRFLSALRQQYGGETYTLEEFTELALEHGIDFNRYFGDWVNSSDLPGFVVSDASTMRLENDDEGRPVYETRFNLHNGEPVPGALRLSREEQATSESFDRIEIGGLRLIEPHQSVQVAVLSQRPPTKIIVDPYLALNRQRIDIHVPTLDDYEVTSQTPSPAWTIVDWTPAPIDGIIVDDLDPGFDLNLDERENSSSLIGLNWFERMLMDATVNRNTDRLDEGLPTHGQGIDHGPPYYGWYRGSTAYSFGKYRRTDVRNPLPSTATFSATIPKDGTWQLHYFIGKKTVSSNVESSGFGWSVRFGAQYDVSNLEFTVVSSEPSEVAEIRSEEIIEGWNPVGEYVLPREKVDVVVTSRGFFTADAIWWKPVPTIKENVNEYED